MTQVEIGAHSLSPQGEELISVLATFPRIILAEVNTHRMLSKNTSSSRAIPFFKMVEAIRENPFIPIAWQKHHSGMQGTEYIMPDELISAEYFADSFIQFVKEQAEKDKVKLTLEFIKSLEELHKTFISLFSDAHWYTTEEIWIKMRDLTIFSATMLYVMGGVTKQLANRLLEPFMWTTMLITGSKEGWDNFFELRCPIYEYTDHYKQTFKFKSRIECQKFAIAKTNIKEDNNGLNTQICNADLDDDLFWLQINKGQAEIHMMALAEKIYDAMSESIPKQLQAGEWHIPFKDKIEYNHANLIGSEVWDTNQETFIQFTDRQAVKVSTAMAARTSYTIVGDEKEINYDRMIRLHDLLISQDPPHSSPMEHCAKAMDDEEYDSNIKGACIPVYDEESTKVYPDDNSFGWCRNFKGFIPYRHIIESQIK